MGSREWKDFKTNCISENERNVTAKTKKKKKKNHSLSIKQNSNGDLQHMGWGASSWAVEPATTKLRIFYKGLDHDRVYMHGSVQEQNNKALVFFQTSLLLPAVNDLIT